MQPIRLGLGTFTLEDSNTEATAPRRIVGQHDVVRSSTPDLLDCLGETADVDSRFLQGNVYVDHAGCGR